MFASVSLAPSRTPVLVKVCTAPRHNSKAIMAWIQQVAKRNIDIANLEVSDKLRDDLDVALAEAVFKVVNNSLLKEILYYHEIHAKY